MCDAQEFHNSPPCTTAENCNHTGMTKTVKHKHPGPKAGGSPGGEIAPLAAFALEHRFPPLLHFLLVPRKQANHSACDRASGGGPEDIIPCVHVRFAFSLLWWQREKKERKKEGKKSQREGQKPTAAHCR